VSFGSAGSYKHYTDSQAIVEAAKDVGADPFSYTGHGNESVEQVLAGATPFFEELVTKHRGKTVVVVAHGALIRQFVRHLLRLPREDLLAITSHDNTAYTTLSLEEDGSFRAHHIAAKDHLTR
jgi:broad specificity phosphatase PhoE